MSAPSDDAAAAVAAIDALLDRWSADQPDGVDGATGTVHLHATDAEGEWLVELGASVRSVRREHAKGDVALRGPASALSAVLDSRASAADDGLGLECFGDAALLDALVRALATLD